MNTTRNRARLATPCIVLAGLALLGCTREHDVNLYVALDQDFSQKLLTEFERRTGLTVRARYDTENTKTVGLVNAIVEERGRPRCDVFWNNELAHTLRLANDGLLAPYASPSAARIPERWRDPEEEGRWHGFAARARILIVNDKLVPKNERPASMWDLIDPRWKGQCGVARPLTGTTLTHFAALRGVLGEAEFTRFVDGLFANEVVFLPSNGATMRNVVEGKIKFAFTDTDDFNVARTQGHEVSAVFPDQGDKQVGTMLIPNSIALIAGCKHPEAAKKLIDFVLSTEVEGLLAASASAQIPLRKEVPAPAAFPQIATLKAMDWEPAKTAASLNDTIQRMAQRFGQ
jgi:iron(III) transport system substrate-binding protein